MPSVAPPAEPPPISLQPSAAPEPAFTPPPEPAPAASTPTPLPHTPPATLTFGGMAQPEPAGAPAPAPATGELSPFSDAALPPSTAVFGGGASAPSNLTPSTQEVLARLAKPAPAPPTAAPRPPRSNKPFLIGAALVVVVLGVVMALFLRKPKDLAPMADIGSDGKPRLGAEAVEDSSRPPLVKPRQLAAAPAAPAASAPPQAAAAPGASAAAPAPAEAPQAASQAKIDGAVAMVKSFPLDGTRGTVGQWLQYSYTASPDAGKEDWKGSQTADNTYLVEYRFTPSAHGASEKVYLFEADMERGFVIGKNLDAKNMLAGAPPAEAKPKAKPAAKKKPARAKARKPARRAPAAAEPKEVPLLPLPDSNDLRPPSEDDGAFTSDTVNSGI